MGEPSAKALRSEIRRLQREIQRLNNELAVARLESWSARKGLIAYMDEHGIGDRVNADIRALIDAGPPVKVGKPNDH